jgi:hypothetical protein
LNTIRDHEYQVQKWPCLANRKSNIAKHDNITFYFTDTVNKVVINKHFSYIVG